MYSTSNPILILRDYLLKCHSVFPVGKFRPRLCSDLLFLLDRGLGKLKPDHCMQHFTEICIFIFKKYTREVKSRH